MKQILIVLLLVISSGCASTLSPHFIQAMREHRNDTELVNQSLIRTFQEEMDKDDRPDAKAAYREIINNLNIVSHQSAILQRYVWDKLTEDEFILVLRSKWRIKP